MKKLILAAAILSIPAIAAAEAGAGLRVGTTGLGVDLAYKINDSFSARIGYSYANFNFTVDQTDVEYDAKVKLSNLSLLADWNVIGGFRITAGLVPQKNRADVTGTPTNGTYTINGTPYPAASVGTLSGRVEAGNSVSPYLGIGYGIVAGRGVNFYADLGVQYQGSPQVSLTANCGAALSGPQCSQLRNDVAAEEAKLRDDLKGFKWYPVLSVGLTVGF